MKFHKPEMIAAIAEQTSMTKKDAEVFLDAFFDVLAAAIKEGKSFVFPEVGTLKVIMAPEREFLIFGKEKRVKPAHQRLKVKVAASLKEYFEEKAGI